MNNPPTTPQSTPINNLKHLDKITAPALSHHLSPNTFQALHWPSSCLALEIYAVLVCAEPNLTLAEADFNYSRLTICAGKFSQVADEDKTAAVHGNLSQVTSSKLQSRRDSNKRLCVKDVAKTPSSSRHRITMGRAEISYFLTPNSRSLQRLREVDFDVNMLFFQKWELKSLRFSR